MPQVDFFFGDEPCRLARPIRLSRYCMLGTDVYGLQLGVVQARGARVSTTEIDAQLTGRVSAILRDDAGAVDLDAVLAGLAQTAFESANLEQLLRRDTVLEAWRVGEALAESFLVEHRACVFPWPTGRDLKNPAASPAGTDLVGFQIVRSSRHVGTVAGRQDAAPTAEHRVERADLSDGLVSDGGAAGGHRSGAVTDGLDDEEVRFAFGEVKTSQHAAYPPSVLHGRHGMVAQLERLRDERPIVNALIQYLGLHCVHTPWRPRFQRAARRWMRTPADVALFGVMIRDVVPHEDDVRARFQALARGTAAPASIELHVFYLPRKMIRMLPRRFRRVAPPAAPRAGAADSSSDTSTDPQEGGAI